MLVSHWTFAVSFFEVRSTSAQVTMFTSSIKSCFVESELSSP